MSIFANKKTKVMCQGITGTQASFHIRRSIDYGTNVVCGVVPGKGGSRHLGVPVFDTVREAKAATGANVSVMYVPAALSKAAIIEAAEAELELAVCITNGIPIKDMLEVRGVLKRGKTKLIGPNTPGIITPGEARLGIFPENIHKKGKIGIVSRSSTLTYEAVIETNIAGLGQSTVVGIGDDMVIGLDYIPVMQAFMDDPATKAIVLIGQQGGLFEEQAAAYYKSFKGLKGKEAKPVIGFIAGSVMPPEKMGYAGDLITNGKATVRDKMDAMDAAGMAVVEEVGGISRELKKLFG